MSSIEAPSKGVVNVKRRTWDKEFYAKQAELRATGASVDDKEKEKTVSAKEEFQPAPEGAAGPLGSSRAFLKARSKKLNLEETLGVSKVKTSEAAQGPGYYCEICECTLKDSVAYLDHINSKRHQSKLGYSMRIERSSVSQVKEKFQSLKRKQLSTGLTKKLTALEDYERKIEKVKEEEEKRKRLRKEEKKKAKEKDIPHEIPPLSEENDEMMAMMGFGGFSTNKK